MTTERLQFRQLVPEDENEILGLRSNERVNQFLTRDPYKTIYEARAFINKINKGVANGEWIYWAITHKNENKLVGTICLWNIQPEHYRAEIGYELHPGVWRKGIMREAIPKIVEYGFENMKLHSIEADLHPDNISSIKLLEKNGFVLEGHFRESVFFNGKFLGRAVYSLLNDRDKR
ncbi:MAG: GNAT family protein [Bacteroidota bacterium]|nr:GNAT family protein [Bacteroidota bacterium]